MTNIKDAVDTYDRAKVSAETGEIEELIGSYFRMSLEEDMLIYIQNKNRENKNYS